MDDGVVVEIRHQLPAGGSHREKGSYLVRAAARRVVRWPSPRVLAVGRGRAGLADGGRRRWWAARIPSDCRGWYNRRCLARGRSRVGGRQRPAGRRGPEYLVARVVVAGRVARRRPPRAPGAREVLLVGLARGCGRRRLQRDLAHHLGRRVLRRVVVVTAASEAAQDSSRRLRGPAAAGAAARGHGGDAIWANVLGQPRARRVSFPAAPESRAPSGREMRSDPSAPRTARLPTGSLVVLLDGGVDAADAAYASSSARREYNHNTY